MKKLSFLAALLLIVSTAFAQNLFVGTYNIRNNSPNGDVENGNGWDRRVSVISGQINFEQPDIFGTQEVLYEQLTDLEKYLPDYGHIGVGRDDGIHDGEHELIWYRKDRLQLLDNGDFWLAEVTDRPTIGWDACCERICSWGKFKVKGEKKAKTFFYFNLHMDHIGSIARRESAKLVVKKIVEIAKGAPVILTGDFNTGQDDETYKIFTESGLLKDSYVAAKHRFAENGTFNCFDPAFHTNSRIDHIFVSPATTVHNYAVMTNCYWTEIPNEKEQEGRDAPKEIRFKRYQQRCPSDHFPIWAKITL